MPATNSISADKLARLIGTPNCPALIDVRPSGDLVPGAVRRDADAVAAWAGDFAGQSVVAICHHGGERSAAVAAPVAGVAMGLIKEGEDYIVLTDIAGVEDHLGDMDFKVAGTEAGITSLQMDIKIAGITEEIMKIALAQINPIVGDLEGNGRTIIDYARRAHAQPVIKNKGQDQRRDRNLGQRLQCDDVRIDRRLEQPDLADERAEHESHRSGKQKAEDDGLQRDGERFQIDAARQPGIERAHDVGRRRQD